LGSLNKTTPSHLILGRKIAVTDWVTSEKQSPEKPSK